MMDHEEMFARWLLSLPEAAASGEPQDLSDREAKGSPGCARSSGRASGPESRSALAEQVRDAYDPVRAREPRTHFREYWRVRRLECQPSRREQLGGRQQRIVGRLGGYPQRVEVLRLPALRRLV